MAVPALVLLWGLRDTVQRLEVDPATGAADD